MMHLQMISLPEGPLISAAVANVECGTAQEELTVRIHRHEPEDLQRALDEARAQEVVDAEGTGGHCARGIGAGAGEERPDLVVVQDPSVPVVGFVL